MLLYSDYQITDIINNYHFQMSVKKPFFSSVFWSYEKEWSTQKPGHLNCKSQCSCGHRLISNQIFTCFLPITIVYAYICMWVCRSLRVNQKPRLLEFGRWRMLKLLDVSYGLFRLCSTRACMFILLVLPT